MTYGPRVSREQAAELLDFGARPDAKGVSDQLFDEQLNGAVAAHNMLQTIGMAYIADEVGTGKTLVAAGALALLRHRDPSMRALIIAPRANLQSKWQREMSTFARYNVRYSDLRVRGIGREPVRPLVIADRLSSLLAIWAQRPDVDAVARLSSFQLGHKADTLRDREVYLDTWREVLASRGTPSVQRLLDSAARSGGETVKLAIAACANRLLPQIDVLVVDEAHNLKGGANRRSAGRNQVLWTLLGHNPDFVGQLPGYGPRTDRVLMLSATPMEDRTEQLMNQLQVLGLDERVPNMQSDDEDQRLRTLHSFLFRRLSKTKVAGEALTRNRYRQEWREGGTVDCSEPLRLDDVRAKLTFAVVQKKVADALNGGVAGRQFQIGMMASFESLAESTAHIRDARARAADARHDEEVDMTIFDDAEQNRAANAEERRGIDEVGIRDLVNSHIEVFGRAPTHPKMDAVVTRLVDGARRGRKALVFTRRVASVDELIQRVNDRIDEDLAERLRHELSEFADEIDSLLADYRRDRSFSATHTTASTPETTGTLGGESDVADDESAEPSDLSSEDQEQTEEVRGGASLFQWLFRERDPAGALTGWSLRQQLERRGGAYTTVLRENWVAAALGCEPPEVLSRLRQAMPRVDDPAGAVDDEGQRYLGTAVTPPVLARFRAAQLAALHLLEQNASGAVRARAAVAYSVLRAEVATESRDRAAPVSVSDRLAESTLATAVRSDSTLAPVFFPDHMWEWANEEEFRLREWRWRLISSAIRLDFPAIDLWLCEVKRSGGLRRSSDPDAASLIGDFVNVLRRQQAADNQVWTSYDALSEIASNASLILEVNGVRQDGSAIPAWVGNRVPAVGMSGQVNATAVRQFRTPTYPLVLISTDLLQEGEDLHTFCDEVHHYGIAWMPSALEQRTGRIDRINSLAQRRLSATGTALGDDGRPPSADRLQVLYPFISGTYEQLQVRRVLTRLDEHIRLLHEGFGHHVAAPSALAVDDEIIDSQPMPEPATNLGEPYKIRPHWLVGGRGKFPLADSRLASGVEAEFKDLASLSHWRGRPVNWLKQASNVHLVAEVHLENGRYQPLDLRLSTAAGRPAVRITSPVGLCDRADVIDLIAGASQLYGPRMGVIALGPKDRRSFSLTVEDLVLSTVGHLQRALDLRVISVLTQADLLEQQLLAGDRRVEVFAADLNNEALGG